MYEHSNEYIFIHIHQNTHNIYIYTPKYAYTYIYMYICMRRKKKSGANMKNNHNRHLFDTTRTNIKRHLQIAHPALEFWCQFLPALPHPPTTCTCIRNNDTHTHESRHTYECVM